MIDEETESGGLRDASDADPALLPPALPSPEDSDQPPQEGYEEPGDRVEDGEDPNLDMGEPA